MAFNLNIMIHTVALLIILACNAAAAYADLKLATSEITNPPKDLKYTFGDSEGFIWYATPRGLYRDDNFSLKYFPIEGEETGINMIDETAAGDVALATDDGVWVLSKKDYKFAAFDPRRLDNKSVSFIKVAKDGSIWVGQKGKLSRYDSNGEWKNDYPLKDRNGKPTTVSGFCETRGGRILMSSFTSGIQLYDKKKDRFVAYRNIPNGESLGVIIQDKDHDYFWVHDFQGRVYRFDPSAKLPEDVFVGSKIRKYGDLDGNMQWVRDMVQDSKYGYLWCSSRHGLHVMRPDNGGRLTPIDVSAVREFDGAFINGVLPWQNAIRVTCYNNPSLLINLDDESVSMLPLPEISNRYHNIAAISDIVADDEPGLLWMLQMRTGLVLYDLAANRMSDSEQYHNRRLYKADVISKSMVMGGVWVSGSDFGNIYCVGHDKDLRMELRDSIMVWKYLKEGEGVAKILEDNASRLWVGTSKALLSFDLRKPDMAVRRFKTGEVADVIVTPDGLIWTAGKNGITRINPNNNEVRVFRYDDAITALTYSTDGHIWAGSKNGKILSLNPLSGEWQERADRLGRGNDRIDKIFSDKYGHLWIVSENNVTQFNPRNSAYRHYRAGEKGRLDLYLGAARVSAPKEDIMVGGMGGLTVFTPSNALDGQSSKLMVMVSDVKVNGESVYFKEGKFGFSERGVILPSDAGNIEFHFTAKGNPNPSEMRFAYKMEGVDADWNFTEPGNNKAFYNRLPKGKHRLLVKASDENNMWTDLVTTVSVNREPAFYASWWAILIYILGGVALVGYILNRYSRHLKDQNETMWADSNEMIKMREYLESPVDLPDEEFRELDKILLKKVTEVVEKNLSVADFSVVDLASGVNMSKSTLARKLKAISGKTPSDFIKDIRIQHACRLLESQNHTVAEVADMVGFDERRYFTSIFKKEVGVTPSAYQKGERKPVEAISLTRLNHEEAISPKSPDQAN